MHKHIIEQIIITMSQWNKFKEKQYEDRYEQLMNLLQKEVGTDRKGAIMLVLSDIQTATSQKVESEMATTLS